MDKAQAALGTPPPDLWRPYDPVPAPQLGCWLRVHPPPPAVLAYTIEQHPWLPDSLPPEIASPKWTRVDEQFETALFTGAREYIRGMLYAAAWLREFDAANRADHALDRVAASILDNLGDPETIELLTRGQVVLQLQTVHDLLTAATKGRR